MVLNIQELLPRESTPGRVIELEPADVAVNDVIATTPPPSLRFHGTPEPKNPIQRETAQHRIAAYMIASGGSIRAIAEKLEVAEATLRNWTKQPFFQAMVATILHQEMGGDVTKMLKTAAAEALLVTTDLMHNSQSDQVRLKAAQDVLDRYRGKPTNFVHHTGGSITDDPAKEMKQLEEFLELKPAP